MNCTTQDILCNEAMSCVTEISYIMSGDFLTGYRQPFHNGPIGVCAKTLQDIFSDNVDNVI